MLFSLLLASLLAAVPPGFNLNTASYEELQNMLQDIMIHSNIDTVNIVIQSARECSFELKKEVA